MDADGTDILTKVQAAFAQVFPHTAFDENISMETMAGWTSLRHVQLLSALERLFDVEFEPTHVARLRSIRSLIEFLATPSQRHA